jgi:DNA-binding Lrp family transcriptional regulator
MHLDADAAIIALLIEDTRVTNKSLARLTGLPESTVRARLGRILRSGAVVPTILVHPDVEGERFLFVLRIRPTAGEDIDALVDRPAFAGSPWSARSWTSGHAFVQFSASTLDDMLEVINQVRLTDGVDEVSYSIVSRLYVGSSWRAQGAGETPWAAAPTRSVDDTDKLLIDALRHDGRSTYTELAIVSGLTVAATRRRVLRLVEDGVIRFATRVESEITAAKEASVDLVVGARDLADFIASAVLLPSVRYVIEQSGDYNVACYVVAPDTATLAHSVATITGDHRVRRSDVDPYFVVRDRLSWTAR